MDAESRNGRIVVGSMIAASHLIWRRLGPVARLLYVFSWLIVIGSEEWDARTGVLSSKRQPPLSVRTPSSRLACAQRLLEFIWTFNLVARNSPLVLPARFPSPWAAAKTNPFRESPQTTFLQSYGVLMLNSGVQLLVELAIGAQPGRKSNLANKHTDRTNPACEAIKRVWSSF